MGLSEWGVCINICTYKVAYTLETSWESFNSLVSTLFSHLACSMCMQVG